MGSTRLILLCLALSFLGAPVAHGGYIHSSNLHPAVKRVDLKTLQESTTVPSHVKRRRRRVQLEPIFEVNPLSQNSVPAAIGKQPVETRPARVLSRDEKKQAWFVLSAAALAGFADVLCLAQFGCFVNMMTGNLLKMSSAIANLQGGEASIHALLVVSYMAGVSVFSQIKRTCSKHQQTSTGEAAALEEPLRFVAPIIACLFIGADVLAQSWGGNAKILRAPCLALGFGVVNMAAAHVTQGTIFFALTGHLSKITNALSDFMATGTWTLDAATKKSIVIVRSFLGGAFVAAALLRFTAALGIGMALPVCTSLGLLYASLFSWYAPMTPLVARLLENSQVSRKIAHLSLRIRSAFAPRSGLRHERTLIPSPVRVDIFPVPQDLLFASNGTMSAYSGY